MSFVTGKSSILIYGMTRYVVDLHCFIWWSLLVVHFTVILRCHLNYIWIVMSSESICYVSIMLICIKFQKCVYL